MQAVLRFRGRNITEVEIAFIRALIAANPTSNRQRISRALCEAWNWLRQPNGHLRDMLARGLLLALHRAGHIELPPPRPRAPMNYLALPNAERPAPRQVQVDDTPLCTTLAGLGPLTWAQVRRTPQEALFNWLMHSEHYLGHVRPVGENLKFMVFAGLRPVALFAWSSAPRHLGPRDRYIGWSQEVRRKNINLLAYNTRFLVPGWVRVPHLASHLLSRMTRMLPVEWEKMYGHPVYFAETFVDPERHRGTCYRAANWVNLGRTQGLGKDSRNKNQNRSLKDVLGLPLTSDFRERLCG
jgi:hypothetical protein